jgi:hypothetical protein
MTKIEMSFTKDEVRLLTKLLYTGYYVCDSEEDSEPEKEAKELLVDRFLQIALTYKVMDGIEYESKFDRHFLDADHEDELLDDYNEFIENSFWDELIFRLGRRDLESEVGATELRNMADLEKIRKEEKHMDKYRKEVEEYGIQRIGIVKGRIAKTGSV